MATTNSEGTTFQSPMEFVGSILEPEELEGDSYIGQIYWANERFDIPGLYIWTGKQNKLIIDRDDLIRLVKKSQEHDEPRSQGGEL